MSTFPKMTIVPRPPVPASYNSYVVREMLEAATQTFVLGAPLIDTGGAGFVGESASPAVGTIVGFALRAGQNSAVGTKYSELVLALPGLTWYSNFLLTAGADNVIAQTDLFVGTYGIEKAAVGHDASTVWFAIDGAGTQCKMLSMDTDWYVPNTQAGQAGKKALAGDTNARVEFELVAAARALGT